MKKSIVIIGAVLFFVILISAKKPTRTNISFKKFEDSFVELQSTSPYVKFENLLYVGMFEVTNAEFRQFTDYLLISDNKQQYLKYRPDSLGWNKIKVEKFLNPKPMAKKYSSHPAYDRYPVVNVSHEAAVAYCNWLTKEYNKNPKREYKKVLFRLPTEIEWNIALSPIPGGKFPFGGELGICEDTKCAIENIKFRNYAIPSNQESYTIDIAIDGAVFPIIVGRYPANKWGIYDAIGNVAEMTNEPVNQKGGSWDNFIDECAVDNSQHYETPDPRVGFRVFMEVLEK
jgi:formylglycine-generating enzyme required for sulfatase activity